MPGNGKGSSWRHYRLVTSHHATWSCLLSVSNALSTAYLLSKFIWQKITITEILADQVKFKIWHLRQFGFVFDHM